ncbi:hypothetical protein LSPCS325_40580 [Lysinibacillus sp. CTST325]|uniref:hypothetical protein n=1 Tax=Lysinibacillus sp. NPDC056185 TaxID=3345739 RepID=UPI0039EEE668
MDSIIVKINQELLDGWSEVEQNAENRITAKLSEVSYWKYASDEYYSHLPYFHEVNNFKKGRILKNISEEERFSKRTIHSFGFNELDQLIIMQHPEVDADIKFGISTELYTSETDGTVRSNVIRWYPEKNQPTVLLALSVFRNLDETSKIEVRSGKKNWTATHYSYDTPDGKINRIVRSSSGWAMPEEYDLIYGEDNKLDKLMMSNVVCWKRKVKK